MSHVHFCLELGMKMCFSGLRPSFPESQLLTSSSSGSAVGIALLSLTVPKSDDDDIVRRLQAVVVLWSCKRVAGLLSGSRLSTVLLPAAHVHLLQAIVV